MMAAEEILELFDSYWFQHQILSSSSSTKLCNSSSSSTELIHHQELPKLEKPEAELPKIAIFRVRSLSDRCIRCDTGSSPDGESPRSIISTPRLEQIVFSTKVIGDSSESVEEEQRKIEKKVGSKSRRKRRSNRRTKGISRSLSELEYEELKGFMDLGFVFTEEDKTSSLVSILPGLQRWGKNGSENDIDKNRVSSRPYLSEAWDVLNERRKVNKPLAVGWRFPEMCNEIDMKDRLKAWAHTVASSVR